MQREGCLLAGVLMVPLVGSDHKLCMWCILQCIVMLVGLSFFYGADLFTYAQQRVAEAVQFALVFAFCRFYHNSSCYREAHGRGVEAIIYKALGDIFSLDLRSFFEWPEINDELMGTGASAAGIENLLIVLEAGTHIVGVEDGIFSGFTHTHCAQHTNVGIGYKQDACRAIRSSRHSVVGLAVSAMFPA